MTSFDDLFQVASIPAGYAAAAMLVCVVAGLVLSAWRRSRISKRMERDDTRATARERRMERILFMLMILPTVLIWAAVMGISFLGLVAFARADIGIDSWIVYFVPASLDGISIAYGVQAFRAANKGHDTDGAEKVVLIGAMMSATLNFFHGLQEWTLLAGCYLAFLSLMGMRMFHDLLKQFVRDREEKLDRKIKKGIPKFGERWIWAPLSTFRARRMWIVHPPAENLESTVTNALAHWRTTKRWLQVDRQTADDAERADVEKARAALTPTPRGSGAPPTPHPPVGNPAREIAPPPPPGGSTLRPPTFPPYLPPPPPGGGNGNLRPAPPGVNGSPLGAPGRVATLPDSSPHPGANGNPVNGHGVPAPARKGRPAAETIRRYDEIKQRDPSTTEKACAEQLGITPKTLRDALAKRQTSTGSDHHA